MELAQLCAPNFVSRGHAFSRCVERLLVGFALGPGEMLQIGGKGEPLGAGQRLNFALNLEQCHGAKCSRGGSLGKAGFGRTVSSVRPRNLQLSESEQRSRRARNRPRMTDGDGSRWRAHVPCGPRLNES